MRGGVRMCRENTQKPQIPHCRCRWKDATKPNHFISPNSPSYCRMPLRRWVLRCHTTNWESQQGLLFGPLRRLCTATVITTIIWLPETSNGGVEAAGICIAPFDLGDLNKASARSAKGVKVATSCPSSLVCLSVPLLSEPPLLSSLFWLQKRRSNKNHALKTNITRGWPGALFVYYTPTETDIILATHLQQSDCLYRTGVGTLGL